MESFEKIIDRQIEFNRGKNIFYGNLDFFQFSNETVKTVSKVNGLPHKTKQFLIEYSVAKAIEEFSRVNQYYSFNSKSKKGLREIYTDLLNNIQAKEESIENISNKHYRKLKQWLLENNPFAEDIYKKTNRQVSPIPCSQYSAELQIKILNIDLSNLRQPVLDIGCGKESFLVNYLKSRNFDAVGIDRFKFSSSNLITTDWLEYNYGIEQWGTIISNLGFSNHFLHHNLRSDGNYIGYARAYMNILHSLKIGGRFHYAPDLPFIERYLDCSQFKMNKYAINLLNYKTTIIERLK